MRFQTCLLLLTLIVIGACARTDLIESPKTAYVTETGPAPEPEIIWTSRQISREYDFLGRVEARSWTWDGALSRVVSGAKELRADAIVDVHYEKVGFLTTFQAFAIKFR